MMIHRSTSAPPSLKREVHIQIDRKVQRENGAVEGVHNENGEINSVQSESREVDSVQTFINDFINQGKVYKYNSEYCLELHKAAVNGDTKRAKSLIPEMENSLKAEGSSLQEKDKYRFMICYPITETGKTVLHVAAGAKQTRFVEEMLGYVEAKDLELMDNNKNNAFCFAAMAGAKEIVEMMLDKNPTLLRIRGGGDMTPLYLAALFGQRDTASFLYEKYEGLEVEDVEDVFFASVCYNLYDLALKLLMLDNKSKKLAVINYAGHGTSLHMLAQNPSAFTSTGKNWINQEKDLPTKALKLLKSLWNDIKDIEGENVWTYINKNRELLFEAARLGNSKFLAELINFYPDLVRIKDERGRTIFHVAVLHRHATIFNLMNEIGFDKQFIAALRDENGNTLLHLAATYLDDQVNMVPGAALQMQQELKTFKQVAFLVMPSYRETKNDEGLTPRELFTKEHKKMRKEGEEWMKKTAESCMLVATIITTVVFTAAFSVPGDYNNDGVPKHLKNLIFCSFTVADAITLSSASISILIFLSILTSRYEEEDFLTSLPLKLMVGLMTLFISIATMMLSFSLSFFLAYNKEKSYIIIPILICIFVFGPAILFLFLQRGLLKDIFHSSFYSRFSCEAIDY